MSTIDAAEDFPWSNKTLDSRLNPSVPTQVHVALDVIAISEINEPDENFRMFAIYDIGWKDTRLAFDSEHYQEKVLKFGEEKANQVLSSIWWPDLSFQNSVSKAEIKNEVLLINSDGTVRLHMAIDVRLRYQPDLLHLPFDRQALPVLIESFGYNTQEVILVQDQHFSGYREGVMPIHWQIEELTYNIQSIGIRHQDHLLSQAKFELRIHRNGWYFFWRAILPMMLLVIISWGTFWISSDLGDRISAGIVVVLTIIAFSITLGDGLPEISYLTFMDAIFVSSLSISFLTVIEGLAIHHLHDVNKAGFALKLDKRCQLLFPLFTILTWVGSYMIFFMDFR